MGSKNRPKACLLSFGRGQNPETLPLYTSRTKNLPISSGLFRPKCFAPDLAKCDEGISEKVARPGGSVLDLPRRYTFGGQLPPSGSKTLQKMLLDLEEAGMVINHKKSQLTPTQEVEHLGFTVDFKKGYYKSPSKK